MDDIDTEFRHIQLDPTPRPYNVDKLFMRAQRWQPKPQLSSSTSSTSRAASPPRRTRAVYPLPLELGHVNSPLGGLFDFPELTPLVLRYFDHPREFAVLAKVCKSWRAIAQKRLYEHIWVRPWESGCHTKLVLLFETLHRNPHLCEMVKKLDVRFFPLAARGGERLDLDDQVRTAMGNMTNLESLVWTRDTSLTPELVEVLADLPKLRSLEISGHSYRYYDPQALARLSALEDLRIMMPDSNLGERLVGIVKQLDERPQGGLRGLGLICRSSPLVGDSMLKAMSPALRDLKRLTLWGCTRVSREGIYHLLRETGDIEELSLDASPHSGLLDLSRAPGLSSLRTLSLSFACPHKEHLDSTDLPTLPPLPGLDSLHLTLSGEKRHMPPGGIPKLLAEVDLASLRRLSLLGLVISPQQLSTLLQACTCPENSTCDDQRLEELYISVNGSSTVMQCSDLITRGSGLRVLHVNAPDRWGPSIEDMTLLATRLPRLEQVGSGNRVYEVFRRLADEGEEGDHVVELSRWGRTTTPAYFQIWRG